MDFDPLRQPRPDVENYRGELIGVRVIGFTIFPDLVSPAFQFEWRFLRSATSEP